MREHFLQHAGVRYAVQVEAEDEGWQVTVGDSRFRVLARPGERGRLALEIDGARTLAHVAVEGALRHVHVDGMVWTLERVAGATARPPAAAIGAGALAAPMPGRVLDVLVAAGDAVTRGQPLVLLEAMKMELRLAAPDDGIVARVLCRPGEIVVRGALMVELQPPRQA